MPLLPVHNFTYGIVNPGLGYLISCMGAFLGLRCITRARAHTGSAKAAWLSVAAVSVGATGIWAMHFIAMLGFTIPGHTILYDVPLTLLSMVLAVIVVGVGLFVVGYSSGGPLPIVSGGTIIGIGVATMHYVGMDAMSMQAGMSYNIGLVAVSVLIAIVAVLWLFSIFWLLGLLGLAAIAGGIALYARWERNKFRSGGV